MKKAKDTLKELLIGIVIWNLVFALVGIVFRRNMNFFLGLFLGTFIAVLLAFHMYHTLDTALDMEEDSAANYTRRQALIRVVLMCFCIGITFTFPRIFHILGTMLGIFTLKFAALLNPVIHKLLSRISVNKGR